MMNARICATLLSVIALTAGCRKIAPGSTRVTPPEPAVIAPELNTNQVAGMPQALLWSRADSKIHWQLWDPKVLDRSLHARRPIFVFVGSAQYPGCVESLEALEKDPSMVKRLNEDYVPMLVDTDSCRETALLGSILCATGNTSISFPFLLFLSPEAAEVSWKAIAYTPGTDFNEEVKAYLEQVTQVWKESPDYFIRNSRLDHANRLERIPGADPQVSDLPARKAYVRDATRQLASLYDEDFGTMSGTGGLFPVGVLQCLAASAANPDTPPDIAAKCLRAVKSFSSIILRSAMVDPLDGGIYTARGGTWQLPMSNRTCITQARAVRALASLYAATGDQLSLQTALNATKYAEQEFQTPDGLFTVQRAPGRSPMEGWLWTSEQIDQTLTPEEATLWKLMSGIQSLGNIPGEADPERLFFHLNSLRLEMTPEAAAKKAGMDPAKAAALIESGRKKLIKARSDRNPSRGPDNTPYASASFRMVSAYAALYTATGDDAWRKKALELAGKCRTAFSDGTQLVEVRSAGKEPACEARAFTYALGIQSCLDLAEVTLDENWRIWASDLSTTVGERFIDENGRMLEAVPSSTPIKFPVEDRLMIFDDSTAGVMRMNLARLQALGQEPPPALAPWISTLPKFDNLPVIYTDSILAASFSLSRVIVELPANPSPEWKAAASTLPLDRISRRVGRGAGTRLLMADGTTKDIPDPAALKKLGAPGTQGS